MREARLAPGRSPLPERKAATLGFRRLCGCATAISAVLALASCDQRESLVRVDSEREANRILVVLHDSGVATARKAPVTDRRRSLWDISAPAGAAAAAARKVLVERNLPRPEYAGLEAMLRNGNLIPTPTEDRARLMHALASELEKTLETVESVVEARVHLVLPVRDALLPLSAAPNESESRDDESAAPSATVLVKYGVAPSAENEAGTPQPPLSEQEVRTLVSGGVEGLAPDRVRVVFTPSALSTPALPGADASPPALDARHRILAATTVLFAGALVTREWLLARAKRRGRVQAPLAAQV